MLSNDGSTPIMRTLAAVEVQPSKVAESPLRRCSASPLGENERDDEDWSSDALRSRTASAAAMYRDCNNRPKSDYIEFKFFWLRGRCS